MVQLGGTTWWYNLVVGTTGKAFILVVVVVVVVPSWSWSWSGGQLEQLIGRGWHFLIKVVVDEVGRRKVGV